MDATAALIDALRAALPAVDAVALADAIQALVRGERATIGGNAVSLNLGQGNTITNATLTIGDTITVMVQLPQPIDPLPAALATFASLPLDHLPPPTIDLPPHSRMVLSRNPQFVGREDELLQLALGVADPQPTIITSMVATGLGGIGKTSLVVEFAHRYGRFFAGGVFWLACGDPAAIPGEVAACAMPLGLPVAGLDVDQQIAAVQRVWQDPIPRLLIFDNCEDPRLLDQWMPTIGGCRVLVTARRDVWPGAYHLRLGVLDRADSVALLQRLCPRLKPEEADGLADDLGDLPLALHLAGSYLATYDHMTVDAYRAQLSLDHPSLKGRGTESLPTRHERNVARTFALSYDQLDPTKPVDELARWLLTCAASLAPGVPIPRDLLLAMVPAETPPEDAIDALGRLRALGLLNGDVPTLHRLLAAFVQGHADGPMVRDRVERAVIAHSYRRNAAGLPAAMAPIVPHLLAVTQASPRMDTAAATLLNNLAFYRKRIGDYTGARPLFARALAITEGVQGPDHPDTALSLNNLALVLHAQGDVVGARPLVERALAITEAALGADHPATAIGLTTLAALRESAGDPAGAQPLYTRALAIREAALGPGHPDTAASLNNLAHLLQRRGDAAAARPLYTRALAITEGVLGPDHPDTAGSLNNLAVLLHSGGDMAGAWPLFARALRIVEAALGADHPQTQIARRNLAACRAARDQAAPEAEPGTEDG